MIQFQSNFSQLKIALIDAVDEALTKTGQDIIDTVHTRVPVDTGDLRDSYLQARPTRNSLIVGSAQDWGTPRRGYPTYYAYHVEVGLGKGKSPQPHFIPAWDRAEYFFNIRFNEEAKKL